MKFLSSPSPTNRQLIGIIAFFFLVTFVLSRLFVYLILGHLLPNFFLTIRGVHIHHFTYGVFTLSIVGLYFILKRPLIGTRSFKWATSFYGIGLGLTFDEFGMWIRLQDNYWIRQSYDAVIIVVLVLFNIAFYHSILTWLRELKNISKKYLALLFR